MSRTFVRAVRRRPASAFLEQHHQIAQQPGRVEVGREQAEVLALVLAEQLRQVAVRVVNALHRFDRDRHFVQIVEPVAPVPDGRWVLGEDDLGTRVLA